MSERATGGQADGRDECALYFDDMEGRKEEWKIKRRKEDRREGKLRLDQNCYILLDVDMDVLCRSIYIYIYIYDNIITIAKYVMLTTHTS